MPSREMVLEILAIRERTIKGLIECPVGSHFLVDGVDPAVSVPGARMASRRRGAQNGPAAWPAVVMHPVRCHAKNVPRAESDGKCGQRGRSGIRTSCLLSIIC